MTLGNRWSSSVHPPRIQRKSTEKAVSVKQWRSVLSSQSGDIPSSADWNPNHFQALVPVQQDGAVRNGRSSLHFSMATCKLLCTAVEREKQPVTCSWKMQEPLCMKNGNELGMNWEWRWDRMVGWPGLFHRLLCSCKCDGKISGVEHSIYLYCPSPNRI